MINHVRVTKGVFTALIAVVALIGPRLSPAAEQTLLEQDSKAALASLYSGSPVAKALGEKAEAIRVFPNVAKAGFVVGGAR